MVEDDDWLTILFLMGGIGTGGVPILAVVVTPVREWLLAHNVLVAGDNLPIAIDSVGLDWPRAVIAATLLLVGVVLLCLCAWRQGSRTPQRG